MNWQEIKQKAIPYIEKVGPLVDQAKVYGTQALKFTQKQIQATPIVLKNVVEYESILSQKRVILIGYDETSSLAQEVLLLSPIWSTQAWTDNATIRFYTPQVASELTTHIGFSTHVDMRIFYGSQETFHATDMENIKNWWKNRIYDTMPASSENNTTTSPDPLDTNKS